MQTRTIVASIVCSVMAGVAAIAAATEPSVFERHLPGYEVARFLPSEGRLVLENVESGRIVVMRRDDAIPDRPGVRLETIGPWGAVLLVAGDDGPGKTASVVAPDMRLLLLPTDEGGFTVIEVSPQPEPGLQPEPRADVEVMPVTPDVVTNDEVSDNASNGQDSQ